MKCTQGRAERLYRNTNHDPMVGYHMNVCEYPVLPVVVTSVACLPGLILMSSLVDRWLCGTLGSLSEIDSVIQTRAQVCPP